MSALLEATDSQEEEEKEGFEEAVHDIAILPPIKLDEDTFGMTVCSFTRDTYFIAKFEQGDGIVKIHARYLRLVTTLGLCLVTVSVQIWLLTCVKQFISAEAVHDIRIAYDLYEKTVYGVENCTLTVHGKHRGNLTKYKPSLDDMEARLKTLDFDDQDTICRIPLSQPYFLGVILVIWSSTCWLELRKTADLLQVLMCLKTVKTMAKSLLQGDDDHSSADAHIVGLTRCIKILFAMLSVLRFAITLFLLWVGCRWLLATSSFADLVLNAIALEFILLLKEGFYHAFVPIRNKLDIGLTTIQPHKVQIKPAAWAFAGSFGMIAVSILWVVLYMSFFQRVLTEYKWDLKDVCADFLAKRFEV